jgi:phosphate-selective porin OprO/OprP
MDIDAPGTTDPVLWGFYWAGSFFLTGEHREYKRDTGVFAAVTPFADFLSEEKGPGAWEVALRYSYIDLDSEGVLFGGEMRDYTLGINWFLNPMVELSLNYIHSHLEHEGSARILTMRVALEF